MIMVARQTGRRAGIIWLVALATMLLPAAPAQAQFGREYLRYSMYGTGPYGYGSRGYSSALTPETPAYRTARVSETEYDYDSQPVYHGSLPASRTVESYSRTPAHVPVQIDDAHALARPQYHPTGGGVYGPYGRFTYGFGNNGYRSLW